MVARFVWGALLACLILFSPVFAGTYNIIHNTSQIVPLLSESAFTSLTTNIGQYGDGKLTLTKLTNDPIAKYILSRKVYQYITIDYSRTLSATQTFANVFEFIVPKSFLVNYSVSSSFVRLYYYSENQWNEVIPTVSERLNVTYYTVSVPTFGYFAIALADIPVTVAVNSAQQISPSESQPTQVAVDPNSIVYPLPVAPKPLFDNMDIALFIGMLATILIAGIAVWYVKSRPQVNSSSTQRPVTQAQVSPAVTDAKQFVKTLQSKDPKLQSVLANIQKKYQTGPPTAMSLTSPTIPSMGSFKSLQASAQAASEQDSKNAVEKAVVDAQQKEKAQLVADQKEKEKIVAEQKAQEQVSLPQTQQSTKPQSVQQSMQSQIPPQSAKQQVQSIQPQASAAKTSSAKAQLSEKSSSVVAGVNVPSRSPIAKFPSQPSPQPDSVLPLHASLQSSNELVDLVQQVSELEERVVSKYIMKAKNEQISSYEIKQQLYELGIRPEVIEIAIDRHM